jgi:PAS domain S-box-containing protein
MTMSQQNYHPTGALPSMQGNRAGVEPVRRRRADAIASAQDIEPLDSLAALSPHEIQAILHDLRVHQIELEMQNEELRRAQLEIDATRARYFDLYDLAPVGYCTLSEKGLILEANLTAANLLGVTRQKLINQPISRFILTADQDIYYLHRKKLLDLGEAQSCEIRIVKSDGIPLWTHVVATDTQDADGVVVHRVVLSDISDRKRMEVDLQTQNTELEGAKRVADKANLAKSEFLSSMSHELRTPLNAILGFAQLIEAGTPPPTPTQKARIDQILKAGWYLLELVNEILDLAVIESGKLSLSMEPVPLPDLLIDCQAMIEALAQKSGIAISFPTFDSTLFVHADRIHLKQVLINLLSNAVKYNRAGGAVEVAYSLRPSSRLRISVRDKGEGLSEDKLAQLFQPFNRLGQEATKVQGTGIGLVVSKRLVELMGGEIGVQSTVGEGSVFWIEINTVAAPRSMAGAGAAMAPRHGVALPDAVPQTLLCVEDNPANLQLVEELVARLPHVRLLTAADALQGIALARAHQPDVILMDINLPGINGLEALKILHGDATTRHIPVMALSANAMPGDVARGLQSGFFRYVTKPIRITEFMVVLDHALEFAQEQAVRSNQKATSQ